MLKIVLLLFISVGILQAAQKPTSILDEEANAARYTHLPQTVSPHRKPDTSVQVDDEKSPLLQNTNTKKRPLLRYYIVGGAVSLICLGLALSYGAGYLNGWAFFS